MLKTLVVIVAHDKRIDTLVAVLENALTLAAADKVMCFFFDTELETKKLIEKYDVEYCSYSRPQIDKSKVVSSYVHHATGMWEGELMQLSYLRNKVLQYVSSSDYDYLFWLDADVLCEKNTIPRLMTLDADMAMGWYFHKRIPLPSVGYVGLDAETIDRDFKNKRVVDGNSGGNGGVLVKKKVCEHVRYSLYNGLEAEDVVFYRKAINAGFTMKLDLGLHYPHIGDDFTPRAKKFAIEKAALWDVEIPYLK